MLSSVDINERGHQPNCCTFGFCFAVVFENASLLLTKPSLLFLIMVDGQQNWKPPFQKSDFLVDISWTPIPTSCCLCVDSPLPKWNRSHNLSLDSKKLFLLNTTNNKSIEIHNLCDFLNKRNQTLAKLLRTPICLSQSKNDCIPYSSLVSMTQFWVWYHVP